MKDALIALVGTIVGFLFGLFKEIIESRPKLKIAVKDGNLRYFRQQRDCYGQVSEEKAVPEVATNFESRLVFDIFNIGKLGTGITDIYIFVLVQIMKKFIFSHK